MNKNLEEYLRELQARGRYTFTDSEVENALGKSKDALRMAFKRLVDKGRIVRVHGGFFVIVPPEYSAQGMLPVSMFIDDLFAYMEKPYYVGLLSAAALHGAAHQQPQQWTVMINRPPIRSIQIKGVRIDFISRKQMPEFGITSQKTDTGEMRISNPALTLVDLFQFERQSGGFQRVIEISEELSESIETRNLQDTLSNATPKSIWQRIGFVAEFILEQPAWCELLEHFLSSKTLHPERLSPGEKSKSGRIYQRWQIIENIDWKHEI